MRCLILAVIISFGCQLVSGENQHTDSTNIAVPSFITKQIVPAGLITCSVILQAGALKKKLQDYFPDTNTRVDDYTRYAPFVQLYTFDLLGVKHKNSVEVQSGNLALSLFATSVVVQVLKEVTHVQRPSGGSTAFPSSHSALAFTGATVVYHEFRDENMLLACSGFATAGLTGILRITNDAHWLPDVLAGAGLGILITNLVYHSEPFHGLPSLFKKKDVAVIPVFTGDGLCLRIVF